jgi:hypothetical protein
LRHTFFFFCRRRGGQQPQHHRATGSHSSSASTDSSSSFDSSDDDDLGSATDEEICAIQQRDSNPFHSLQIPRIVVESNSPVPTLPPGSYGNNAAAVRRGQVPDVVPASQYVAQRVPLGPTPALPPGTALYKPRYQHYRTPDLTAVQPAAASSQFNIGSFYRPASAVSNSLKKNWVVPGGGGGAGAASSGGLAQQPQQQQPRRVDQSEIDARLKSLMDRLSSQQVKITIYA